MRFPFVVRGYVDLLISERDRLLEENSDLRGQVKKLTDCVAAINRIPPPFRETSLHGGVAKVSATAGVFQRQKMLERKRQGTSQ